MSDVMQRPDPSSLTGMADTLRYLMDRQDEIFAILNGQDKKIKPAAAERALGYPAGYFSPSRYPWRVPDFGAHGTLRSAVDWNRWNVEKSEAERRRAWETMPLTDRRKILGMKA